MEKLELIVWLSYGSFVVLGLLIFIAISCAVRAKNKTCEDEQAFIRMYNNKVAQGYAEAEKAKEPTKKPSSGKESFSLFNLLT